MATIRRPRQPNWSRSRRCPLRLSFPKFHQSDDISRSSVPRPLLARTNGRKSPEQMVPEDSSRVIANRQMDVHSRLGHHPRALKWDSCSVIARRVTPAGQRKDNGGMPVGEPTFINLTVGYSRRCVVGVPTSACTFRRHKTDHAWGGVCRHRHYASIATHRPTLLP